MAQTNRGAQLVNAQVTVIRTATQARAQVKRLRSGSPEATAATAALARQGRYQQIAANLRVKDVRLGDGDRFIVCFNPDAATRDAAIRARLLTQLQELIAGSDNLSPTKRAELRGQISTKPGECRCGAMRCHLLVRDRLRLSISDSGGRGA